MEKLIITNQKHDNFFVSILEICAETENYILSFEVLDLLKEYFLTLSPLLAYQNALKIGNLIRNGKSAVYVFKYF